MTRSLLIVSILGDDEVLPAGLYDGAPHGENDLQWMQRRLRRAGLDDAFELTFVDISRGDALPSVEHFDAVVMGGSIHNANEDRPWQRRGIEWLRAWRATGRPFMGICGGHQLAAVALGGSVEVMGSGPNASTEAITLTPDGREHYLFERCGQSPRVHLGHYDHVARPPSGANVLAHHDGIVMALDMGGGWATVQFHPEASADLMVRGWGGTLGDLEDSYDSDHLGQRIVANFFVGSGLAALAA